MDKGQLLSAKGFAVQHIRARIHAGDFDEDGRLSVGQLAEQLGVSRTPVRDALWHLAGEGLVVVNPRVGAFLRRLTPAEAADIYHLKATIEPMMAAWAAERPDAPRRRHYLELAHDLCAVARQDDVERYVAALESQRAALLQLAGSPPLSDMLAVIDGRVRLLRFKNLSQAGRLRTSSEEHLVVAEAIAAGDAPAASRAMADHMNSALSRVLQLADGRDGDDHGYWLSSDRSST